MSRPGPLARLLRLLPWTSKREGIAVRVEGYLVVVKATEFRSRLSPKNARIFARALDDAADMAERHQARAGEEIAP